MSIQPSHLAELTAQLAQKADDPDREADWPADSLRLVAEAGWRRCCIDARHGGSPLAARQLQEWYEALGAGNASIALIVTQHDAAVDLIGRGDNEDLKDRLLPRFEAGELLATVGISQLTTSRQGGEPAMKVVKSGSHFLLRGVMPWVTSAAKATHIVTGGVLPDGSQLLACVGTDRQGVKIEPPMRLMALQSSLTSLVRCGDVIVRRDDVIRGPAESVLSRRSPIKPLTVSSVGIGVAGALLASIESSADARAAEFREVVSALRERYRATRERVFAAADRIDAGFGTQPGEATEIRVLVNDVVGRMALAAMTFAKGSGYVLGHRAQRLVRQAMFLLVWSAPTDVRLGTLERIGGGVQ